MRASREGEVLVDYLRQHVVGLEGHAAGRVRWWVEKILEGGMAPDAVEFVVRELADQALGKENPAGWCVWCTQQAGFPWISDLSWERRKPRRTSGGPASLAEGVDLVV